MDPWRVYVYNEGLVRFASEEYNASNIKSNKFAHLTNYSINKKSETFVQNQNADQSDLGHKWSIGALTKHLEGMGIDNDLLWSKIYDVIIKSLLAVDGLVQQQLKKSNSKNNCFELFGFDVMIDSDLKPWLLEVNLSPSLACDSPIDLKIKHALFLDTMNLISIRKFDRRRENLNKMKLRAKNIVRAKSYQSR
jgi:tubulin polyglutamylase TTLL5|tara:strand:+ start:321 stop:899 length:579 start_codon:yes stop_codon:yes gene_type:complete